jgi:Peptidase family C25
MLERNERPWGEMLAALPLDSELPASREVSVMRTFALVVCLLGAISPPVSAWASPTRLDDADVVVVLPSASRGEADQMKELLGPWARRVGEQYRETSAVLNPGGPPRLKISYVSLSDVVSDGAAPAAEDVRQYLRNRYTSRATTTERPRYLAIAALPYAEYVDPPETVELAIIPRFHVAVRDVPSQYTAAVETDVPYGFLVPDTIDGGDGFVDPGDLDMRSTTFTVFRIPLAQIDDLRRFVDRSNDFAEAPYHNDVTLVSGEFGLFPGDTSVVQCINANQLSGLASVGRIFKVLDYPSCPPDFLVTGPTHRLADFLADASNGFKGGMIYDISHGSGDAIYAASSVRGAFPNLASDDLDALPTGSLNVFVSISCDNDESLGRQNFAMAMYLHDSVAVVSATEILHPTSLPAILDAEITAFVALYRSPLTLLQALHQFRAEHYVNYVLGGPVDDRPYNWINLLAVHVLGDGLTIVSE